MVNIFLAPRSNETSHKNFDSTIISGRTLGFLEPYLSQSEKDLLSLHGEKISIWGNKLSLRSRWEAMRPGDYVLFYARGQFYYSAKVILTKYSEELGSALWPPDEDGHPWPCLFFVDDLREVQIPIKALQELADYSPTWDRVQGFMRLNDRGVNSIADKFGSVELFLNQPPAVYRAIETVIETGKEETLQDEIDITADKDQLLAAARSYVTSRPSHVITDFPRKIRIENRIQKKRIAALEDYSCQVCNWSLEWTNDRGKKVFRIDVDHIIEKADGGGEEMSNLWVLCPNCHAKKTLGVIVIDPHAKKVSESNREIKLHHDHHLNW